MALTPEEERALEYQRQERRRLAFERSLQAKLKPDPERARQTKKNWLPLTRDPKVR